jgi:hypothetical protein
VQRAGAQQQVNDQDKPNTKRQDAREFSHAGNCPLTQATI